MNRLPWLDVLRFAAVTLVIGRHFGHDPVSVAQGGPVLMAWQRGGWVGVDLFFVLSGFLVSGLLFDDYTRYGRFRIGRFYLRRAWKIYPSFYALLLIALGMAWVGGFHESSAQIAAEALFAQNYFTGVLPHTWSLAVEEHFYAVLPLILWCCRTRIGAVPWIAGAVIVGVPILRTVTWQPVFDFGSIARTHVRFDGLFVGVLLSYIWRFYPAYIQRVNRRWLLTVGVLGFVPAFVLPLESSRFIVTFGLSLFSLSGACLIAAALISQPPVSQAVNGMAWLGARSYSIYLWHIPVMGWIMPLLPQAFWLQVGLSLVLCYGVGCQMARLIEFPALRLRDRIRLPVAVPVRTLL